jgi:cell division control protein 6
LSRAEVEDDIEKIFGFYASGSSIFVRKDLLQSSYVPKDLPHREAEVRQLAQMLAPSLRLERPSNIFIYGKPGTGKTAAVRFVGSRLQGTASEKGIPVRFLYINTGLKKVADTEYRLYAHICRLLGDFVPDTGIPTHTVFEKMTELLNSNPAIYLVVLDEIDVLVDKSPEALYTLSRINTELENSKVSLLGITNNFNTINGLDSRTKSSLSEEELVFLPYDADQLRDILKGRCESCFSPGVLDDSAISLCAASAAKEHGDARRALELLRISAEIAEREASLKVVKKHVEQAVGKLHTDKVTSFVKKLPDHQKLVLQALMGLEGPNYTREIYDRYVELSSRAGVKGLTMRRVLDIIGDFEAAGLVYTKVISRGRYGRTKVVELATVDNIKDQIEQFLVNI